MDQQELQNKIAEYYAKLPEDLQKKFSSMSWLENLRKLSTKYNLSEEQVQILGTETTLVLLGILHLGEYASILVNELNLEESVIENLLVDLNDEIFREIAPKLSLAFEKNNKPEEVTVGEKGYIAPTLEKKLETAPEVVKDAVRKSNYSETLFQISKEQGLNMIEAGDLDKIISGVISGEMPATSMESRIKEKIKLDGEKLIILVNEINEKILKNIRGGIMENTTKAKNDILKDAGIEILQNTPELKSGNIPEKKLAEPFKIPKSTTEYSLNNISKSNTQPEIQNSKKEDAPNPQASYSGSDPYRMPIE